MKNNSCTDYNELMEILEISIQMAKEKDRTSLLSTILNKCMEYTGCDAGTLYLYENDALTFKIMKTGSLGICKGEHGEVIDLPPVPLKEENICAYAAIHKKVVNFPDVRDTGINFDFLGPKRYDEMTGYNTQSMLVVPLINQEDVLIGVLQLINALDSDGNVVCFEKRVEPVICSLASQAAIVLSNLLHVDEMKKQLWSFTEALAEAVDTRTPYNGNHIRKVAEYVGKLADHFNFLYEQGKETEFFDTQRREQLIMGALLHDIGKMILPLEIMNKTTRLEGKKELVYTRLDLIWAYYDNDCMTAVISEGEAALGKARVMETKEIIELTDAIYNLDSELSGKLEKVMSYEYHSDKRGTIPFFKEDEKECMRVKRGNLTKKERAVMESHVEMTEKILSKVHFNPFYTNSIVWAATHHELLDGSGYPKGLKGDELLLESRMMAVADICDALLATDRPYKKPLPKKEAFKIMLDMADEGKLERRLVEYMQECI